MARNSKLNEFLELARLLSEEKLRLFTRSIQFEFGHLLGPLEGSDLDEPGRARRNEKRKERKVKARDKN
jgi:hypothetical protein